MELRQLIEIQKSGALKVVTQPNGGFTVGGIPVTDQQAAMMANNLGWIRYAKHPAEIIDKTNKFVRSIVKNSTNEFYINGTHVSFENQRISGTMKYFDRIKLVNPMFDYTILYGMPGTGGTYAIYDATSNNHLPVYSCRSLKQVAEFFSDLYEMQEA